MTMREIDGYSCRGVFRTLLNIYDWAPSKISDMVLKILTARERTFDITIKMKIEHILAQGFK